MGSAIEVGVLAWVGICAGGYLLIRRIVYSVVDPVTIVSLFIPFAGSLLAVLCFAQGIPWGKFDLFLIVLAAYGAGALVASMFFSRSDLRYALSQAIGNVSRKEIDAMYLMTIGTTVVLGVLGFVAGASGDARQDFARAFRPLVVAQSGLALFSLVLLLSPSLSRRGALLRVFALQALSIPFSGKSVLVPIVVWYGMRKFVDDKPITLKGMLGVGGLAVGGAVAMATLAYGAHGIVAAVILLTQRMWLSGDTYIYAYQLHGLDAIRGNYPVTFIDYMLHPLTSLVGIRAYDRPLGAMIMSALSGTDVLTGPNPHLPILLDFFFPGQLAISFAIAFGTGLAVFGLRPLGVAIAGGRGRYLRLGGAVAAIFCPAQGFLDTSQVLISLIGIAAVVFLGTFLELITTEDTLRGKTRAQRLMGSD